MAVAILARVHAPAAAPVVSQAFIGFIIAAISAIASWFGAAGAAVANASIAVLEWTMRGLSWLGGFVKTLVQSTGAMFAKVWEGARALWSDVLRPALQKIYSWIDDFRKWLRAKLEPVFKLLGTLRKHIRAIYGTFVEPVLHGIEVTRGLLKLLELLHVPFAKALDRYLAEVEAVISENYLRLLSKVNETTDFLHSIVTGDLLFQRVPFLATLKRDSPSWIAMWWNAQMYPLRPDQRTPATEHGIPIVDPALLSKELAAYYQNRSGELAPLLNELVPLWFVSTQ